MFKKLREKRDLRKGLEDRELLRKDVRAWLKRQTELRNEMNRRLEACEGQLDVLYVQLCNRLTEVLEEEPSEEAAAEYRLSRDLLEYMERDNVFVDAYMVEHGWKRGTTSLWEKEDINNSKGE